MRFHAENRRSTRQTRWRRQHLKNRWIEVIPAELRDVHTVNPDIQRPDREVVEAFEDVPSTIASDVTGNVGFEMDAGIEPAYDGIDVAGTAVTVKAAPGDNLIIHKAITLAEPGDILVINCDGYTSTGHIGELMCTSCQANGLAGIVIDGGYRDRRELGEMEFPVYGRGTNPRGPLKQDPGSINVPVSCGGVSVDPGDVVVGDDDGITVVPRESAADVLELAHGKMEAEDAVREEVETGAYLFELNGYDELYEDLDVVGPEDSVQ